MNLLQLKTRCSRVLGLALGTSDDAVDEDALLTELANEAVFDILLRTRVHVRHGDVLLTSGYSEFDIDAAQILRIHSIDRGEATLYEQALSELDTSGFAFPGHNRLLLGSPGVGETATIWFTPVPTPLSAPTDDPSDEAHGFIPSQFHRGILSYMLWHAADQAGDSQAARGERYRAIYEGQDGLAGPGTDLGRIKLATNARGGNVIIRRRREVLAGDRDASFWVG
jgi:hypothetical protein